MRTQDIMCKSTNEMKVAELREALEARGLDSSGLKPALVARLQAALDRSPGPV